MMHKFHRLHILILVIAALPLILSQDQKFAENTVSEFEVATTTIEPETESDGVTFPSETETTTTASPSYAVKQNSLSEKIRFSENAIKPPNTYKSAAAVAGNKKGDAAFGKNDVDVDTWEAPLEVRLKYPYYLSGYDYEYRPIWVSEIGKFNVRKVVEEGGETLEIFDRYVEQGLNNTIKALFSRPVVGDFVNETTMIFDFDEFSMFQLAHLPTVEYLLGLVRRHRAAIEKHLYVCVAINVNFVASAFINMVKPIAGNLMERLEIYGTNRVKWIPHLLRHFPQDQLPEWYGGSKGHKPIKIFG